MKKMTDYRKLRELVTSGTQLSSVTVLDLIDQALEAQEDAIHQTARAEQAEAQVRRVRGLHKPVPVYLTESGECEHGDECEGIEVSSGDFVCPDSESETTCEACAEVAQTFGLDGELPIYPCDTIKALDGEPSA